MSLLNTNEELILDYMEFDVNSAIAEINREENLYASKLYLLNFCATDVIIIIRALPLTLSHSLESFTMHHCNIHLGVAQVIVNLIKDSKLQKIEILNCVTIVSYDADDTDSANDTDNADNADNADNTDNVDGTDRAGDALFTIINAISPLFRFTLNLCGAHIKKDTVNKIVDLLGQHCFVKLSIKNCIVENDGWILMLEAVQKSALQTLMLNDVHFNYEETIAAINCVTHSQLTKLSLRGASFVGDKLTALIGAIKQSLLKTLDMRDTKIRGRFNEINDLILLSNVVKFNFDQFIFSLDENILFVNSILQRRSSSFEHVFFDSVYFDDQLLAKVCNLLENPCLTGLDLVNCSLSESALKQIVSLIKKSSVTSLSWGEDNANIRTICDLLENHHLLKFKLKTVHFEQTRETMKALLDSIKKSTLIKFDVDTLPIEDTDVLDEIKRITKENQRKLSSNYKTKSARSL